MDFYFFKCSLDEETVIVVSDDNPANIPADAINKLCNGGQWTLVDEFAEGNRTYPPEKEAQIKKEIQAQGYYWTSLGPTMG